MAAISKCPSCQEPVSIPLGVEAAAAVRCPLCGAEYTLGVALALSPPELIPLSSSVDNRTDFDADSPGGESLQSDNLSGERENEAAAVVPQFATPSLSAQLRARRPRSTWRTLLEVVSGGLAGCLVAYYGLALWFGPQFQNVMPKIRFLPFIEQITAPAKTDDGKEPPAPKKPAKTKPTSDVTPGDSPRPAGGPPASEERGARRPGSSGRQIVAVASPPPSIARRSESS